MSNGIMIGARDNVVVATDDIRAGERIEYHIPGTSQVASVTPTSDIPLFHKVALCPLKRGDRIIKYGEYIGVATCDIALGDYVHTHNCASQDDVKREVATDNVTPAVHTPCAQSMVAAPEEAPDDSSNV